MVSAQQSDQLYVKVKRIEGQVNGGNWLNLTAASRDSIMAGAPWKVQQPEYEYGTSPVLIRIIDPTALQTYDYTLNPIFTPTKVHSPCLRWMAFQSGGFCDLQIFIFRNGASL